MTKHYRDPALHAQADDIQDLLCHLLHAAYTHWLAYGMFAKDFAEGVRHHSALCLLELNLSGEGPTKFAQAVMAAHQWALPKSPDWVGQTNQPHPACVSLAPHPYAQAPAVRFYNDEGLLGAPDGLRKLLDRAVMGAFCCWLQEGWNPDEFRWAVLDAADIIEYDHDLRKSLGTLGGGRSEAAHLSEPYFRPRRPSQSPQANAKSLSLD